MAYFCGSFNKHVDQYVNYLSVEVLMEFDGMLHKVICRVASLHPKDSDAQPGGVDDMTKLVHLHEPGVFYNLASRYELDDIYVSAALSHYTSVCLAAWTRISKYVWLYVRCLPMDFLI
jgi:hypothetical protein